MLNRPVLFLWFSVNIKKEKHFRLAFPLFLPSIYMFLDMADELFTFLNLVSFNKLKMQDNEKIRMLFNGLKTGKSVFIELMFKSGPTDLINIDISGKEKVRIVCKLV